MSTERRISPFGEIASFVSGNRPQGGVGQIKEGALSLGGEHVGVDGKLALTTPKYVPLDYFNNNPKGHVQSGDILLCKDGALSGKVALERGELSGFQSMVNEHVFIIRTSKLNQKYLFYYLFSPVGQRLLKGIVTGAAQGGINGKNLKSIPVVYPDSLNKQQRIVDELDLLTDIIDKKNAQLRDLDTLVDSLFFEMFGEAEVNQKGFPLLTIDDVIQFQGGSQPDKKFFEYEPTEDNVRLIQIRDYKTDRYITYVPKELARRFCTEDDIMIGRYGPPIFQILKGISGAYNVALMKAVPKQGNKDFIRVFLMQKRLLHYLESFSRRVAGQDGIQMDKLKSYPFPFPPMGLQNRFAEQYHEIEKQKKNVSQSIAECENLLSSRMSYYFD